MWTIAIDAPGVSQPVELKSHYLPTFSEVMDLTIWPLRVGGMAQQLTSLVGSTTGW